ncbi:MAG: type IX secretion system PorP/SprF family membrane protein [Sphingobacteriales bacterium]|jgi:type IX secretion system PorP/SprF family membrane protein
MENIRQTSFMRFILLVFGFGLFAVNSIAQQAPQISQYMFNPIIYNPGNAGVKEGLAASLLYRNQFTGFGEGQPVTQTISVESPISFLHGGVGLHIVNDEIGFENDLGVYASYAYAQEILGGVLSTGISLGVIQKSFSASKFKPNDQGDIEIPTDDQGGVSPDINIGGIFKTPTFYLGASMMHAIKGNLNYASGAGEGTDQLKRHYFLTAGYNYPLTGAINLQPSVLIKIDKLDSRTFVADLNTNVVFNEKYFAGLSYRLRDAFIGIIGLNITDRLKFSYSYDFTTSRLLSVSNGSHEVLLRYEIPVFAKSKSDIIIKSPRFL